MENKEIMAKARESLTGRWGLAIGVFLVYWVISELVISLGVQITPLIGLLAWIIIAGAMLVGLNTVVLALSRREETKLGNLFDGFSRFGTTLAAYLLQAIFIFLWTLLLIIPGIIAAYAYSMTFFILAEDHNIGAKEAIRRSKMMMQGNKWKLFCLTFRFIGWMILSILTLGIGFIWLAPYMSVSFAIFYDDIKNNVPPQE